MIWKRNCPKCFKERIFKTESSWLTAGYNLNRVCRRCANNTKLGKSTWNKGLHHSEKTLKKISKSLKGRIFSKEWIDKISLAQRIRLSEEMRGKNRNPRYNLKACKLFDIINNEMLWNGRYGTNGGEFYIKELGYWVDYYEPNLNLVIEYNEKHHSRKSYQKKDQIRHDEIIKNLNCKFLVIKENEDWRNILCQL